MEIMERLREVEILLILCIAKIGYKMDDKLRELQPHIRRKRVDTHQNTRTYTHVERIEAKQERRKFSSSLLR
jgi:hypothetical protein